MVSKTYINCDNNSHLEAALTLTHIANERGSSNHHHHEAVQQQELLSPQEPVFQRRQHELEDHFSSYARISNSLHELQRRHDDFQSMGLLPSSSGYAYVLDIKPIPVSTLESMARNHSLLAFDDRFSVPRLPPHLMNLPTNRDVFLSEPRSNFYRPPERQLRNAYYVNENKHLSSRRREESQTPVYNQMIQQDSAKQKDAPPRTDVPAICTKGGVKAPFPVVLWRLLHTIETKERHLESIISWQSNTNCFRVHDKKKFEQCVQPRFFKQTNYTSFRRQLNLWGFQRIPVRGELSGAYFHPSFKRDDEYSCRTMTRPGKETMHSIKKGK
ncbi:hypothetical protein CTEN210_02122 [Chaetoceros tenuissimus]|uniref:HSF-type DNA-binding domain-containing protein n=1 Tax=Chaetoceros tenuissimus TaxID=426638 RepID=A0AAD3H0K2_9STRA|nr:hypothetical protein CTEN210_02122 [Chaetoceros tenuissimus]